MKKNKKDLQYAQKLSKELNWNFNTYKWEKEADWYFFKHLRHMESTIRKPGRIRKDLEELIKKEKRRRTQREYYEEKEELYLISKVLEYEELNK